MESININLLKTELMKMTQKMEKIAEFAHREVGKYFDGYDICDNGIYYKSYDHYPQCSREDYSFYISFDEMDNDLPYFKSKFETEYALQDQEKLIEKEKLEKEKELKEMLEYDRLMKKYGTDKK
jgi:hypothetical protein